MDLSGDLAGAYTSGANESTLFTVDPLTRATATFATVAIADVETLAFVPGPGSAALPAMGGVAVSRRRRA